MRNVKGVSACFSYQIRQVLNVSLSNRVYHNNFEIADAIPKIRNGYSSEKENYKTISAVPLKSIFVISEPLNVIIKSCTGA